jgi:hypothetical protein
VLRTRNSRRKRGWVWIGHLTVGALCFTLGLMILRSVAPASPDVLLPGTALTVRLIHPLSSRNTQLGDTFEASVDSAQGINGNSPVPPSLRVEGRCVAVRAGELDGHPGYLRLALSGLWDFQGHLSPLETTTVSLSGKGPDARGQKLSPILNAATSPNDKDDNVTARNNGDDVIVTPDVSLTFVLLKPAVVPGRHWTP